jgi:alcohol dehydrogenase class IV
VFGSGTLAALPAELARLGVHRALILSTAGRADLARTVETLIPGEVAARFAGARMHTPVEVTEQALALAHQHGADCTIAIGGGSTIGLGKAIAARTDLPQVCIPTTYAGSEMTAILGETKDGVKSTRSAPEILPEVVIYDVALTLSLPAAIAGASGVNAIAHAVEALYARDRNPIISLMAEEGIAALARALPAIAREESDRAARSDALYGAFLCGTCLGAVGMALHHKLCHALGGSFDLPHAQTHAIVLPHALAYNAAAAPDAMARIARALGTVDAARGLFDLTGRLALPRALEELGMRQDAIDRAADIACSNPYWNPRPLERGAIRALIARAWAGDPPQA